MNTSVRFTIEEHRALRAAATRSGTTISEWIRAACAEAVERANDPVQQELQSTFRRIQEDVQYAHDLSTKVAKRDAWKSTGKSGLENRNKATARCSRGAQVGPGGEFSANGSLICSHLQ